MIHCFDSPKFEINNYKKKFIKFVNVPLKIVSFFS